MLKFSVRRKVFGDRISASQDISKFNIFFHCPQEQLWWLMFSLDYSTIKSTAREHSLSVVPTKVTISDVCAVLGHHDFAYKVNNPEYCKSIVLRFFL